MKLKTLLFNFPSRKRAEIHPLVSVPTFCPEVRWRRRPGENTRLLDVLRQNVQDVQFSKNTVAIIKVWGGGLV